MVTLFLYALLAIVVIAGLFALAVYVLPKGEQVAPPAPDTRPWDELPDRQLRPDDVVHARLPVALRGYRFAETDLLLDRLTEELRLRDEEIARLRGARPSIHGLSSAPSAPPAPSASSAPSAPPARSAPSASSAPSARPAPSAPPARLAPSAPLAPEPAPPAPERASGPEPASGTEPASMPERASGPEAEAEPVEAADPDGPAQHAEPPAHD